MAASETGSAAWPGRLSGGGTTVSVIVATAIVVADMVGVGVFTSLGFQVKDIPSGFSFLLLWSVGGVVGLWGASWRCAPCSPTANSLRCCGARAGNTISSAAPFIRRSGFWSAGYRRRL